MYCGMCFGLTLFLTLLQGKDKWEGAFPEGGNKWLDVHCSRWYPNLFPRVFGYRIASSCLGETRIYHYYWMMFNPPVLVTMVLASPWREILDTENSWKDIEESMSTRNRRIESLKWIKIDNVCFWQFIITIFGVLCIIWSSSLVSLYLDFGCLQAEWRKLML